MHNQRGKNWQRNLNNRPIDEQGKRYYFTKPCTICGVDRRWDTSLQCTRGDKKGLF
jgi:hypothetical protein